MENELPDHAFAHRQCLRLRLIGAAVLALGLTAALLVYALRPHSKELDEDFSTVGYRRAQSQQMGVLFGKSGLMTDELLDSLKRPEIQARLIGGFSIIVAGIFFYLGRPLDDPTSQPADGTHRHPPIV